MIPCAVIYIHDGLEHRVETMTPGLPAPGTRFEFHDSDRAALGYPSLAGIVTRVLCIEDDGDFSVTIYTRPPRDGE